MNKKIIISAVTGIILAAGAAYSDPGDSAAAFLRIGVGARPAAMGEAYAGVDGDILSLYSNPAGLASLKTYQFSVTHAFWLDSTNYSNFAGGAPLFNGYMALGLSGLFYGEIDKYKSDGSEGDGSYSPSDMAVSVSYARDDLIGDVSVGGTFKLVTSQIDSENATAVAVDIGAMKKIGDLNAGLSVQNIGTEMKYRNEGDPLPLIGRLGASYPFSLGSFNMQGVAETNFSRDVPFKFNAGINADYPAGDMLVSLRLGLKSYAEGLDAWSHLATGMGLVYENIVFDYAFASFEDLGMTHRVSLGYRFN